MHPFREQAQMLRELITGERRMGGKWADPERMARWRREAEWLEHLARLDRRDGNPEGYPPPALD